MPKVSVVIPVFGVENYIEKCARSLFGQTLDDIEYLFVDDCTPDDSISILLSVLEEYPERKPQVIIHKMETNSGQAAVRTWGMKNATGDFVIHCDSDDWLEPDAYLKMYEKAIEENADVAICDFVKTDGINNFLIERGCSTTNKDLYIERLLFQIEPWSLVNKLFRRTDFFIEGLIYPKGNMGEDMAIVTQLLLHVEKIAYIPEVFYNYFYNANSITHVVNKEKILKNIAENKINADIAFDSIQKLGMERNYAQAILWNKWYIKRMYWNVKFDKKVFLLWRRTFQEINDRVLFCNRISIKEKIKYILTYMRLYPR